MPHSPNSSKIQQKMAERLNIDIPLKNTWLGITTLINCGGVE
jgi:hypothetical protein